MSYETGDRNTQFSAPYLVVLTVREALAIIPPIVLPFGTVSHMGWSTAIPSGDLPQSIDPRHCVPHIDDIWPLLADQPCQYAAGMRSIKVSIHGKLM